MDDDMEKAIKSWRLVVCKREKPPREEGDERPASSPASPRLVGYTKEGSQSAPWSDSTTWWPEEEASTVHCCLECELMHSLHWAGRTFLLGLSPNRPGHFPSYESCLSYCCPPQSSLPKWKHKSLWAKEQVQPYFSHTTLIHLTLGSTTTLPQA